jgi:hypothetical protein
VALRPKEVNSDTGSLFKTGMKGKAAEAAFRVLPYL